MTSMKNDHLKISDRLRCGMAIEHTQSLIDYFDELEKLLKKCPANKLATMQNLINELHSQYSNDDWLGMADTIQYDLAFLSTNLFQNQDD